MNKHPPCQDHHLSVGEQRKAAKAAAPADGPRRSSARALSGNNWLCAPQAMKPVELQLHELGSANIPH